jgi:hypothetical protein
VESAISNDRARLSEYFTQARSPLSLSNAEMADFRALFKLARRLLQ